MTIRDIRDAAGNLIPPAQTARTLYEPWITGTMPSWLEGPTGTGYTGNAITYSLPAASYGYVKAMSAATSGSVAAIRTSFDIATAGYDCIEWAIDSFALDASDINADVVFRIYGTGAIGGYYVQSNTDTAGSLVWAGVSKQAIKYNLRVGAGEGPKHRNLRLRIFPRDKEVHLYENDRHVAGFDCPTFANGIARPEVQVVTRENVSHGFQMSGTRLTLWHN